ncbi:MAG: hypothetical protein HY719_06895 [Planctomycetes bacterium]|nr:hypothetical protein [Planctomycetota bacterium]
MQSQSERAAAAPRGGLRKIAAFLITAGVVGAPVGYYFTQFFGDGRVQTVSATGGDAVAAGGALSGRLKAISARVDELSNLQPKLEKVADAVTAEQKRLRTEMGAQIERIGGDLKEGKIQQEEYNRRMETVNREYGARLEALEGAQKTAQADLARVKQETEALRGQVRQLDEARARLESGQEANAGRIADLETQVGTLEQDAAKRMGQMTETLAMTVQSLEVVTGKVKHLQAVTRDLQERTETQERRADASEQKIDELRAEVERLKQEIASVLRNQRPGGGSSSSSAAPGGGGGAPR